MSGYFSYGGHQSNTYGVYITGEGTYNIPSRQIKRTNVPGRDGDILDDYGNYPNVEVTYHCSYEGNDINAALEAMAGDMFADGTYKRLDDTYNPDTYRMAIPSAEIRPQVFRPNGGAPYRAANFDIVFSCKPQRFLRSDPYFSLTASGTVTNPTGFPAKPILNIAGTGTVTIGDQVITIDSSCPAAEVTIDCETMDAHGNGANLNQYVFLPLQDIVFAPGANAVTLSGVTRFYGNGRWWKL